MLKLGGKIIRIHAVDVDKAITLAKVSTSRNLPEVLRREMAYLVSDNQIPHGFAHYLLVDKHRHLVDALLPVPTSQFYRRTIAISVMATLSGFQRIVRASECCFVHRRRITVSW